MIAVGACAISGGLYAGHPETCGGASAVVPVDVFIPGCPPRPEQLIQAIVDLQDKIQREGTVWGKEFDAPARQSFLIDMVEDQADLPNAIALNSSMVNVARLVGPSIAGLLIAWVGEGWCFFADGGTYFAIVGSLLAMRVAHRPRPATGKKVNWTGTAIFRFNGDGKIVERWQDLDNLSLFQQLGVIPAFGPAGG